LTYYDAENIITNITKKVDQAYVPSRTYSTCLPSPQHLAGYALLKNTLNFDNMVLV